MKLEIEGTPVEVRAFLNPPPESGILETVLSNLGEIMATQAEQTAAIKEVTAQFRKARAEYKAALAAAVKKLEDATAKAGNTTPEQDAAFAELKSVAQAQDDDNPDTPGNTPAVEQVEVVK